MSDDVGIPAQESYKELKERLRIEQCGKSRKELLEQFQKSSEYAVDLNNLPKQKHIWIQRGIVISCEGAGHPGHRHFMKH